MSSKLIIFRKRAAHDLEKMVITKDDIPAVISGEHLCWNCSNGYPSKCSKIADLVKGNIDIYDFIKSGYQLVKDGDVARFVVTSCLNYEEANNTSKYSGQEFRQEVGKLFTGYYGTETVREAIAENHSRNSIFQRNKVRMWY